MATIEIDQRTKIATVQRTTIATMQLTKIATMIKNEVLLLLMLLPLLPLLLMNTTQRMCVTFVLARYTCMPIHGIQEGCTIYVALG